MLTFLSHPISLYRNFFHRFSQQRMRNSSKTKIAISVVYAIQSLLDKWVNASRARVNKVLSTRFTFLFIVRNLPFHQSVMIEWIKTKWRRNSTEFEIPLTCCLNWTPFVQKIIRTTISVFLGIFRYSRKKINSLDKLVSHFALRDVF